VHASVLKRKVNVLLLCIPLVLFGATLRDLAAARLGLPDSMLETAFPYTMFALAALSLIPLAGFVESAVEELAELLGPFVGGLLHTTFGNVAELAIGVSILLYGGPSGSTIVMGSIAGVIVRNSLLGLGLSTLLGAWRNGHMKFDAENASEYTTVFSLAVIGLSLPTIAAQVLNLKPGSEGVLLPKHIPLSVFLAIVLLVSYLAYICFAVFRLGEGYNLVERRRLRRDIRQRLRLEKRERRSPIAQASPVDTTALFREEREAAQQLLRDDVAPARKRVYARAGILEHKRKQREARGEKSLFHSHPVLRGLTAVLVLGLATAGVASMSENFAHAVEEILHANANLEQYAFFLGLIVIPVLAGIVELYGSISAGRENRMEIAMAVTAGATIQMILLVVPILVLVGFRAGHPIDLVFKPLNVIVFGAATFVFMLLTRDGEATWLEGAQLCTLWSLVAVTVLFLPPA
jgi:Ca2+:H+ antiporter